MKKKKTNWSRIKAGIIPVCAILGTIAAILVVPEFRILFGLPNDFKRESNLVKIEKNETIFDLFPSFIGSKWDYRINHTSLDKDNEEIITQGEYSQTVISYLTGLADKARVVRMKTNGVNYINECTNFESFSGEDEFWYVMDSAQLFIACSENDAMAIAHKLIFQQTDTLPLPAYIAPMKKGTKWDRFEKNDVDKFDTTYVWYVESIVNVSVPAGSFENCFRILLHTNPDDTIRYICPGIGLTSEIYSHHGSPNDYTIELVDYSIP